MIKCYGSGKELSEYKGDLRINVTFGNETRVYSFYNLELEYTPGTEFPNYFQDNFVDGSEIVNEYYPKIEASIISPFSEQETTLVLKNNSLDQEIGINKDVNACETDVICEANDLNEKNKFYFYEMHLKSSYGKYRGDMSINFSDIKSSNDLLKKIEQVAYEEFDWFEGPKDCLNNSLFFEAVEKISFRYKNDPENYCEDIGYVIRKERYKEVLTLFEEAKKNMVALKDIFGSELEFSWLGEQGCMNINDMLNQFFSNDTEVKNIGKQILDFYKKNT